MKNEECIIKVIMEKKARQESKGRKVTNEMEKKRYTTKQN